MSEELKLKKGTTTVGIVCKDGIVLAADKRASAGYLVANKDEQKVVQISDNIAVTTAGLVSDIQLITKLMRAEISLKKIRTSKDPTVKEAANLMASIVYANIRKFSTFQSIVGFLMAGKDNSKGFSLYEIGIDGSLTKSDEYLTDGSGMMVALGVLESNYKKGLSIDEGIKLAVRTINAAIQRDTPTGNGIDVFTITSKGVEKAFTKKVDMTINV